MRLRDRWPRIAPDLKNRYGSPVAACALLSVGEANWANWANWERSGSVPLLRTYGATYAVLRAVHGRPGVPAPPAPRELYLGGRG